MGEPALDKYVTRLEKFVTDLTALLEAWPQLDGQVTTTWYRNERSAYDELVKQFTQYVAYLQEQTAKGYCVDRASCEESVQAIEVLNPQVEELFAQLMPLWEASRMAEEAR